MTENLQSELNRMQKRHREIAEEKFNLLVNLEHLGYFNLDRLNLNDISDDFCRATLKNIANHLHDFRELQKKQPPHLEKADWESWVYSSIYHLYPALRTKIFHRTNINGFKGITSTGNIIPNKGQFPFSYPQTPHYYGYSKSYISLFDFASSTDEERISIHHTWGHFLCSSQTLTILIELDRSKLQEKLIPNAAAPKLGEPNFKSYVPYLEVWYPEKISLSTVTGYIVTFLKDGKISYEEYQPDQISEIDNLISEFMEQR